MSSLKELCAKHLYYYGESCRKTNLPYALSTLFTDCGWVIYNLGDSYKLCEFCYGPENLVGIYETADEAIAAAGELT